MQYISAFLSAITAFLKAVMLYGSYKLGKTQAENAALEKSNEAARIHNEMADSIRAASDDDLAERMRKYTRK